jgi:hypothetical protein
MTCSSGTRFRIASAPLLGGLLFLALPAPAMDLLVYSTANNGPGSLRQAINDNNAIGGGNNIIFSNIVTGTITLTSGELVISTNVTILGPGPQTLTVSGNDSTRVFNITGGTVAISDLTIANGRGAGAGVNNLGNLHVSNCLFVANYAFSSSGGALSSSGNVTIERCAFLNNRAYFIGGALNLTGVAFVNNCTIVSNTASAPIGTASGGGIYSSGASNVVVANCTISFNVANGAGNYQGGGLAGSASVRNSIIAGNETAPGGVGPDVYGTFTSRGYNLIGTSDGSTGFGAVGDQLGTTASPINPNLRPLGNYGGPTPTMPPIPGSPAIDQGKSFGLATDQRGRARPYDFSSVINATLGDGSDIGAAEWGPVTLMITNSNDSGSGSLRQAILDVSSIEPDAVTFAANVTNTITLTSGEIVLNKTILILGPTNYPLTVSGNNSSRIFHLTGGYIALSGLTIANGWASDYGGGILADAGFLEMTSCQIVSNVTAVTGTGGGICCRSDSSLFLANCSVTHNQAGLYGGGVAMPDSGGGFIFTSTIASNRTTYVPDGFPPFPAGGGIFSASASLLVVNSTVASNASTLYGGGIADGVFSFGPATIRNSIIAGNTSAGAGPDAYGIYTSDGYNLIGNSASSLGFTNTGDQINVNPLLGPLASYGGSTLTMALPGQLRRVDADDGAAVGQSGVGQRQ